MVDADIHISADREMILRSILYADINEHDPTLNMVRGNVKIGLEHTDSIAWDDTKVQRLLDRAGALDQARAEGFAAGLFVATLMAVSDSVVYPDTESQYQTVGDKEIIDELHEQREAERNR